MNDLDSRIAEEIDDEALFRLAEGEEHEFSPSYNEAMGSLYHKATAHPKRKRGPIGRIIVIAAVIAAFTGAATAATFWDEIQQFFVLNFGQYVELQVDPNKENRQEIFKMVPKDWDSFWYPKMIDDKYTVISADTVGKRKVITFQSGIEEVKLYQWNGLGDVNADNEAVSVSGIYIQNEEAYATEKEVGGLIYRTVFWTSNNVSFELRGTPSFDDLINLASSLINIER